MHSNRNHKCIPPGQRVDIGGFSLHAIIQGSGSPTVILEPALGGFALQYLHILEGVSGFTQVVAYDRAGQGWSDAAHTPRTPEQLTGELRRLLHKLNLQPPYILAGHSFGGLLIRIYAGFYPDEVAGIVLIDSSDVDMYDSFPDLDKMIARAARGVSLMNLAARLGLGKLLTRLSLGNAGRDFPKADFDIFLEIASRPGHQKAMLAEYEQFRCYFGPQSQVPRTLNNIPVTIITAENSISGQQKVNGMTGDALNALHQRLQKDLLQLSFQSDQVLLPGATHLSILFQPEHVRNIVNVIQSMVKRVQREKDIR